MTSPDPKVVLQAHALRTEATRHAVLHGTRAPRTRPHPNRALWFSLAIAVVILAVVLVVVRVTTTLHPH